MNWEALGAVADLVGAVVVVVSLLYLAAQVRGSTRQARFDATRELAVRITDVSLSVAESREVGELFFRGATRMEDLDPVDQVRFRGLMNGLFRGMEQQFVLRREGTLDDEDWDAVRHILHDFAQLPGVRNYLRDRAGWYKRSFVDYLREAEGLDASPAGVSMAAQYLSQADDGPIST